MIHNGIKLYASLDYNLLKALTNRKILITGGTGFLGKWLLNTLLYANDRYDANINVTCLSRNPIYFITQNQYLEERDDISFIKGDVRNFSIPKAEFDYTIHAATDSTNQTQNYELHSIIVNGTKNILKVKTQKVLYVSSGGVYGRQNPKLTSFSENLTPNPQNIYGKAKLEAENLCIDSEIPSVIVRPFSFLGPGMPLNAHFAAGNFINDVLHGRPICINSDGSAIRSYMYPTDFVEWVLKAMVYGKDGQIFNVGSDKAVSILELAEIIEKTLKHEYGIVVTNKKFQEDSIIRYIPNVNKIKDTFNLVEKITLDYAILETFNYNQIREKCHGTIN